MKITFVIAVIATVITSSALAQDGEAVYNKSCMFCHASGVGGAARAHQPDAWKALTAKGMDVLLKSVKEGKGNMPAGGMCSSCSDTDIQQAIDYMATPKK